MQRCASASLLKTRQRFTTSRNIRLRGRKTQSVQKRASKKQLNIKEPLAAAHPIRVPPNGTYPSASKAEPPFALRIRQSARTQNRPGRKFPNVALFAFGTRLLLHRLRCRIFTYSPDTKIIQLLARLECSHKPSRFQPASCPSFAGIFRIAVLRGDLSPCSPTE